MKTSELNYELPPELIADRPVAPRDASRLLVVNRASGSFEHRHFFDLGDYLNSGDLMVFNRAKVVPARLRARLEGSNREVELFLLDGGTGFRSRALIKPSKKVKEGSILVSQKLGVRMEISRNPEGEYWEVRFCDRAQTWKDVLAEEGEMPLPPYILKRRGLQPYRDEDRGWYQTVFADREGAIAAPTAGLHFTKELLAKLEKQGVQMTSLFLKVGLGTFKPVKTEDLSDHAMHEEEFEIDSVCERKIRELCQRRGKLIAVGTTVVRALESCVGECGEIVAGQGRTKLMISPPYLFRTIDTLVTNFHLPRSTLLALVYAFGGTELIRSAYEEAIRERYRFFSYGDAMLIL